MPTKAEQSHSQVHNEIGGGQTGAAQGSAPCPLSYILPIIISVLTLIPNVDIGIPAPVAQWPFFILIAALIGFLPLTMACPLTIKVLIVISFLNCFFSIAPYISFTTGFVPIVAAVWLYIGLRKMRSWSFMWKCLLTVMLINSILMVMQMIGHDAFLNFGKDQNVLYGVIGHRMQMASFGVILSSLLVNLSPYFLLFGALTVIYTQSVWGFFCIVSGALIYAAKRKRSSLRYLAVGFFAIFILAGCVMNKFDANIFSKGGRLAVWTKTVHLLNDRPLTGYGIATYKYVFHPLSKMNSIPWKSAHNCWLQLAFEYGWPVFLMILYFVINLFQSLIKGGSIHLIVGLAIISLNMLVHFPTRMIQSVPLIIVFYALCVHDIHSRHNS